jgi:type II restriction enzyme
MESLTEVYVRAVCEKHGFEYLPQATAAMIKTGFGKEVPTDKADRHFDFTIKANDRIYLMEVNYYGGGGSKLKATAGEYKGLFELVQTTPNVGFIWVTDGQGWRKAKRPLRETFDATDYLMNLKMAEEGLLEEILTKGL